MKIFLKLTLIFLIVTLLTSVFGIFTIHQLSNAEEFTSKDLGSSILELSKSSQKHAAVQRIQYYTEILTQSARNYYFTGDIQWKIRYFKHYSLMTEAIKTAKSSIDTFQEKTYNAISKIETTNLKLTDLELQSITYVQSGEYERAGDILLGEKHADLKTIIDENLEIYKSEEGGQFETAIESSVVTLRIVEKNIREIIQKNKRLLIVLLMSLILTSGVGSYILAKNIANPISQLSQLAKQVESGDFQGQVKIDSRDEFSYLAGTFNKAVKTLYNLEKERDNINSMKTEFLSITSHELRSPMTPMRAQLQMLMEEYFGKLNKKQREAVTIVLNNTTRLDKIIVDLLESSRIEAGRLNFEFVRVDILDSVRLLIDEMKGFMPEKNVEILLKTQQIPKIECDPNRVMQVLRNLLNNAIKFSNPNSPIIVMIKQKSSIIQFSVKDNGIGIQKLHQGKIFDPFYQGDHSLSRKYPGTGLGLTICKGIIEMLGGRMWFQSLPNNGSTFYFTIPTKPLKQSKPISLFSFRQHDVKDSVFSLFKKHFSLAAENEIKRLEENDFKLATVIAHIEDLYNNHIIEQKIYREILSEIYEIFNHHSRNDASRENNLKLKDSNSKKKEE